MLDGTTEPIVCGVCFVQPAHCRPSDDCDHLVFVIHAFVYVPGVRCLRCCQCCSCSSAAGPAGMRVVVVGGGWLFFFFFFFTLNLQLLTGLDATRVGTNAVLLWCCGLDLEGDGELGRVADDERLLDGLGQGSWVVENGKDVK